MDNMEIYQKSREVPETAKRRIAGGKLRGFTDINPMWRIKKLTELFGPCGFGWYTEVKNKFSEKGEDGKTVVFIEINLFVKIEDEWSKPIYGIGGSTLVNKFNENFETTDEAYKMAYTDSLSVACKSIGIGADVYFEKDADKYNTYDQQNENKRNVEESYFEKVRCPICHKELFTVKMKDGSNMKPSYFIKQYGMCPDCYRNKHKKEGQA